MSNLGTIVYTVDVETGNLVRATRDANGNLNNLQDGMNRTDAAATSLGGGLSRLATSIAGVMSVAALVNEFKKAVSVTMEFNATISNLSALTGAVGKDLDVFRQAAIDIGGATSLSATQAAEAMKLIGSASPDLLKSADSLKMVTQQAVTLAEAAGSSLPEAADALTGALNQFQLGADQSARVINVLAAGAKEGASEINDTVAAMRNSGVVAAQAGLNFEQFNGAIQALAQGQIKGAEAGTGLRNVLTILNTQVKSNLRPSVVGLSQALENLEKAGLDDTQMVKLFGRENITTAKVMLQFRGTMDDVTKSITGTSEAYKQAATNQNNLKGDVDKLSSAFETLQLSIGTMSDATLRDITQQVTSMLNGFTENKETIVNFFDNAATAGMAFAAVMAGRVVMSIGSYTYAQTAAVKATLENIAANQAALGAILRRAIVEKDAAITALAVARAEFQAAQGTSAHALAADALIAAQLRLGQTSAAVTAALNAVNTAATRGTVAVGLLGKAMGFLGGPAGLILLAVSALYIFGGAAKDTRIPVDQLTKSISSLKNEQLALEEVNLRQSIAGQEKALSVLGAQAEYASGEFKKLSEAGGITEKMSQSYKDGVTKQSAAIQQASDDLAAHKKRLEEVNSALASRPKDYVPPVAGQAPDKDPEKKASSPSGTSEEGQKALKEMEAELKLIKEIGVARARAQLAAINKLGDSATDPEKERAIQLAEELRKLEEAEKSLGATKKKETSAADALAKKSAADRKKELEDTQAVYAKYGQALADVGKSSRDLAMDQAELELAQKKAIPTSADIQLVRDLAAAQFDATQGKSLVGQFDPIAGENANFDKQKADLEIANQVYVNDQKLLSDQAYLAAKTQLETEHSEKIRVLEEQRFAAQSKGNALIIGTLNQLQSAATSTFTGLITGATNGTQAMQALGNAILNEAVGAVVEFGIQQIKSMIIGQTVGAAAAGASITAAAAVGTAWAGPAGLVAIATLGGAGVPAAAALLSTAGIAKGIAASGGGRQYGGGVAAGGMYRVNETGAPEIFNAANGRQYMMPNTRGEVVSNKDATSGGGGSSAPIVNVNNYSGQQANASAKFSEADRTWVVDVIVGDMQGGGKTAQTTNQITGTQRAGR